MWASLTNVLADRAALYAAGDVRGVGQQAGIVEWVAIDEDEVGDLARFEGAQLLVEPQDSRVVPRCRWSSLLGANHPRDQDCLQALLLLVRADEASACSDQT